MNTALLLCAIIAVVFLTIFLTALCVWTGLKPKISDIVSVALFAMAFAILAGGVAAIGFLLSLIRGGAQ